MASERPSPVLPNDFRAQWREIREEALAALDRVGDSGWLVLGSEVASFEAELAAWHGLPFAVGTANGLDALQIALRCSGIVPGDRVITTPLTAFATALAIVQVGAVPVFVDVDASGLLELERVEKALQSDKTIRAVVPVHLYGHALDVDRLRRLGQRFGVAIVEDCAQAIGARSRGEPVGTASTAAATSFYPTKNLGCLGDGGALLTADSTVRDQARSLRDYGQTSKYVHDVIGMNSRLDEVQAAMMRSALLPRLDAFTQRRRAIAEAYCAGIRNAHVRVPPTPDGSESVWHLFPILVDAERERFQASLRESGIATGIHYPILASAQRAISGSGATNLDPLARAAEFARAEVSLPIHPFLDDAAVDRVIDACNAFQ